MKISFVMVIFLIKFLKLTSISMPLYKGATLNRLLQLKDMGGIKLQADLANSSVKSLSLLLLCAFTLCIITCRLRVSMVTKTENHKVEWESFKRSLAYLKVSTFLAKSLNLSITLFESV